MYVKTLIAVAMLLPSLVFAAPEPVADVEVEFEDGKVVVSWDTLDDETVAKYNVYYSTASILDNEGEYDDFESTDGPVSFYEFENIEPGIQYYFAVLPVDENGEEAPGFIAEASITIPEGFSNTTTSTAATSSAQSSSALSQAVFNLPNQSSSRTSSATINPTIVEDDPTTVSLLSVDVLNPTELKLNFSVPIQVSDEGAQNAFKITDADGNELPLVELTIDGDDVRLTTAEQVKNKVYKLEVSEPIRGYLNNEPLDADARTILFSGHEDGSDAPTFAPGVEDSLEFPADVQNSTISYTPRPNGSYDVTVQWDVPNVTGGLAYYMVSQTHDGGATFMNPELIEANVGGVFLPGITAPFFGVKINTVNGAGYVSKGVLQTVQYGVTPIASSSSSMPTISSSSSSTVTTPVGDVTGKPGQLPSSGPMLPLLGALLALLAASLHVVRRRVRVA